jgi:hypothetical protein
LHDESNVVPSCGNARGVDTKDKRKDGSNKRQPDDVCEGRGDAVIDETKSRRKKAKSCSPSERSTQYAELATTSSKGMRMSVKDRPERRKEKAAKNKLAFEHATKPTKSRPKMLKLSPENGGNIILPKDADVGQLPSNKPASKKPGRSMSNASQAVHVDINRTQVLRNNFGLSDAEILAFSGRVSSISLTRYFWQRTAGIHILTYTAVTKQNARGRNISVTTYFWRIAICYGTCTYETPISDTNAENNTYTSEQENIR